MDENLQKNCQLKLDSNKKEKGIDKEKQVSYNTKAIDLSQLNHNIKLQILILVTK
jgi:hypothetical protein